MVHYLHIFRDKFLKIVIVPINCCISSQNQSILIFRNKFDETHFLLYFHSDVHFPCIEISTSKSNFHHLPHPVDYLFIPSLIKKSVYPQKWGRELISTPKIAKPMRTMGAVGALSVLNLLQVALLPTDKEINDDYAQVKKARESLMNLFMQPEVTSPPGRGAIELDTFVIADHLRKFDESDLSLSMDATLLTSWTDQRISWEPRDFGNINEIAVTGYDINLFWVPPVEIKSILPIRKTIMTPYNTELMIKHDGTVLAASKISVKMACESDLEDYPYDKPSCSLYLTYRYFESQNYTFGDKHIFMDRETVAGWNNMTVHAAYNVVNMTATRYYVTGLGVTTDYIKYKKGEPVTKAIGTFVQYQFQIERNHGYYIHHVLLPLYCATLLSLVGASLMNFYNSLMILLFSLLYLVITLARIAANLPPNYEITPYCMTYGTMIFAEIIIFIGYKIGLALYLQKITLKGEEMSKIQLAERLFRYYLFLHALLSYYLLFF